MLHRSSLHSLICLLQFGFKTGFLFAIEEELWALVHCKLSWDNYKDALHLLIYILYNNLVNATNIYSRTSDMNKSYLKYIQKQKLTFWNKTICIVYSASCVLIVALVWNNFIFWLFNTFQHVFRPQIFFCSAELVDIIIQTFFSRAKLLRVAFRTNSDTLLASWAVSTTFSPKPVVIPLQSKTSRYTDYIYHRKCNPFFTQVKVSRPC